MTARHRVSSGSPYEEPIGFSRAVRVGDRVLVFEDGRIVDGETIADAALLAAAILATTEPEIRDALDAYRSRQTRAVLDNPDPRPEEPGAS